MKTSCWVVVALQLVAISLFGEEPSRTTGYLLQDSFERNELGAGWNANAGEWKIGEGVLRGRELAADNHAAAIRRVVETKDAIYELKFRLVGSAKGFHFGFDPARGELKKKGHLFSVVVMPNSWKVLKHVDKNRPKEDPNEVLPEQKAKFEPGKWYSLRVTTEGTSVTAQMEGQEPIQVSHASFGVKKPTLVFRCMGDGVEIDDIKVRSAKAQ